MAHSGVAAPRLAGGIGLGVAPGAGAAGQVLAVPLDVTDMGLVLARGPAAGGDGAGGATAFAGFGQTAVDEMVVQGQVWR
jgi:hypothetical protein